MLETVYPERIISILAVDSGLDRNFYNSQDIRNNIDYFADTEYIFSTWGMPVFTVVPIHAKDNMLVYWHEGTYLAHTGGWHCDAVMFVEYDD